MENAIFNGDLIVALEISKDFDTENMIREEGKYRHLRCPDPNCKSPFLRYCHGEKKQPYFAHLSNVSCDYSDYDKETSPVVRTIKIAIYQSLKAKGICVEMDAKLLDRHYAHLLVTLETGEQIPIELGTKQTSAALTNSLTKQYSDIGLSPLWVLIDDSSRIMNESETFHFKRILLHNSNSKELIVFSTDGKSVTQSKIDENEYLYYGRPLISKNYPTEYVESKSVEDITIENGKLVVLGFCERFEAWLQKKNAAFQKRIQQFTEEENRRNEECLRRIAEQKEKLRLKEQQEEEKRKKKLEQERMWEVQNSHINPENKYPKPEVGDYIRHKELRGMKIIKVDINETTTTITAVPDRPDIVKKYGGEARTFDWKKSIDDKVIMPYICAPRL